MPCVLLAAACLCLLRYVQVRGEKQHTKVMKQRLSCVFDDLFFFTLKGLTAEVRADT
jgi:hypothetical protein